MADHRDAQPAPESTANRGERPFVARDPNFASRVRESFQRQRLMETYGAWLHALAPGRVSIVLPFNEALTQHDGFLHAGVITAILDNACGYAALSLMEPGFGVLTVEFKANFLAPGKGERLLAEAHVLRAGRTLSVCRADGWMETRGARTQVATMQATMMAVASAPHRQT